MYELLKILAVMGISTEKNKKVALVDNDNIELSTLNRQFLFNKSNIGNLNQILHAIQ